MFVQLAGWQFDWKLCLTLSPCVGFRSFQAKLLIEGKPKNSVKIPTKSLESVQQDRYIASSKAYPLHVPSKRELHWNCFLSFSFHTLCFALPSSFLCLILPLL